MLVVRRRRGEALLIGADVEVEILELSASHVKLGIRAPREITVLRREIQATAQQNQDAAREISDDTMRRLLDFLR